MMNSMFQSARQFITPVSKKSSFITTGRLTPTEFVEAGDHFVYKFPTWKWESGDSKKQKKYLPSDKQYLVTRNVPVRVSTDENCQYEWIDTDFEEFEEYENFETFICEPVESDNESSIPSIEDSEQTKNNVIRTRTYDVSITYDKYYQTPRIWLSGYDADGMFLNPESMFEDVSNIHAHKTITLENHPHFNSQQLSVHPCKHAQVMKKLFQMRKLTDSDLESFSYMILFLKFMSSIFNKIEYDYSIEF